MQPGIELRLSDRPSNGAVCVSPGGKVLAPDLAQDSGVFFKGQSEFFGFCVLIEFGKGVCGRALESRGQGTGCVTIEITRFFHGATGNHNSGDPALEWLFSLAATSRESPLHDR